MKQTIISLLSIFLFGILSAQDFKASMSKIVKAYTSGEYEKCVLLMEELENSELSLSERQDFYELSGKIHENLGNLNVASDYFIKLYETMGNETDTLRVFKSLINILGANIAVGNQEKCFQYFELSNKLRPHIRDHYYLNRFFFLNSIIYADVKPKDSVRQMQYKALYHARKSGRKALVSSVYNSIAIEEAKRKNYREALNYYDSSLNALQDKHKNLSYYLQLYNKAISHRELGELRQAKRAVDTAYTNYKLMQNKRGLLLTSLFLASYHNAQAEPNKALPYIREAEGINKQMKNFKCMATTAQEYARYFSLKNKPDSVNKYISLVSEYKDSAFQKLSTEAYAEMNARLSVKEKENTILSLKSRNKIIQLRVIYISAIASLLILLLIIFYYFRNLRIKKEKELHKARKEIAESRLHEQEQEKLLMEKEVQIQNKELLGFAMHIKHNNSILNTVNSLLKSIKDDGRNSEIKETMIKINNRLSENLNFDLYKMKSEEINKQFLKKLDEKTGLSESQKQLCILINSGLTTKEIADAQNTSEKSVEMKRYRLRKALDIDSKTDIADYLAQI